MSSKRNRFAIACLCFAGILSPAFDSEAGGGEGPGTVTLEGRYLVGFVDRFLESKDPLPPGVPNAEVLHFLEADDLTVYELVDFQQPAAYEDILLVEPGDTIRVEGAQMTTTTTEGGHPWHELHGGVAELLAPGVARSNLGTRSVAVLLVNFSNDASRPWTENQAHDIYFGNGSSVRTSIEAFSSGTTSITGQVFANGGSYYRLPIPRPTNQLDCIRSVTLAAVAAADPDVDFAAFDAVAFLFPSAGCGWSGYAAPNKGVSTDEGQVVLDLMYLNEPLGQYIFVHEQGHTYGLGHANSLTCFGNCFVWEYGNYHDVMGSGFEDDHPNAVLKEIAGWPVAVQTVTQDGSYPVSPLEDADPASPQALVVTNLGITHTVEYRGTDDTVNVNRPCGALCRGQNHIPGSSLIDEPPHDIDAGESWDFLDARIRITHRSVGGAPVVDVAFLEPPGVPRDLSATGKEGAASLSWSPPLDDGGTPIEAYVWSVEPGGLTGEVTATSTTVSGLSNGVTYQVKVKARNAVGDGPWAAEVAVTPLLVTATPYYKSNYRVGLSASWNPVPGAASYHVTHFRQDACGQASVVHVTTDTESGSGAHHNCGAPNSCYFKKATVKALDSQGNLLAKDSAEFCVIGQP